MSEQMSRYSRDSKKFKKPRQENAKKGRSRHGDRDERHPRKSTPRFTPEVVHEMLFATKPRVTSGKEPYTIPHNDPLADMDEFFFDNEDETDAAISDKNNIADEDAPIEVTPTLVSETSPWKSKSLHEHSLQHLLTLTLLYHNHFFALTPTQSNSTSNDTTEIPADTPTQWQAWENWMRELSENKLSESEDFFLNQELPEDYFALVFRQAQIVITNASLAQEEIAKNLIGWKWERLTLMRQLVLLVSWVLIKHASPQQVKPLLNDAINHAKWFGDDQDAGFVNSILDKLISEHKLWQ